MNAVSAAVSVAVSMAMHGSERGSELPLLRDELEDTAVEPPLQVARVRHLKHHRVGDLEVRQLLEGPAMSVAAFRAL